MKYVICSKTVGYSYLPVDSNDRPLGILAFFITDLCGDASFFKEWLLSDSDSTGGNIAWLEKRDDKVIVYLDPTVFDEGIIFESSPKQLLSILSTWEKLYGEGWSKIIIIQDDTGVHLEGKNS